MDNYAALAMRTAAQLGTAKADFVHAALGLVTELREYRDAPDQLNRIEELGDILWFVALAGYALNIDPFNGPTHDGFPGPNGEDQSLRIIEAAAVFMADSAKRWHAYNKAPSIERVEGCLWGIVRAVRVLAGMDGRTLEGVQAANIAKLRARYPDKYTDQNAINRDIAAERRALMRDKMTFDTQVGGVPCRARVIHYHRSIPERRFGHPDTWEPAYGPEIAFMIIDSDGLRHKSLEARMSMDDFARIELEALRHMGEDVEV